MRTGALDIHEERVGGLHETLELVLPGLVFGGGVKEIDGESLRSFDNQHYRLAQRIKRSAPWCFCELLSGRGSTVSFF